MFCAIVEGGVPVTQPGLEQEEVFVRQQPAMRQSKPPPGSPVPPVVLSELLSLLMAAVYCRLMSLPEVKTLLTHVFFSLLNFFPFPIYHALSSLYEFAMPIPLPGMPSAHPTPASCLPTSHPGPVPLGRYQHFLPKTLPPSLRRSCLRSSESRRVTK